METTNTLPPAAATPPAGHSVPPGGSVTVDALHDCRSQREAFRCGLELLAGHFDAAYAAARIDVAGGTIEDHVEATPSARSAWRRVCEGLLLSARYKRHAVARFYSADGYEGQLAVLAAPMRSHTEGVIGAVAVVIACPGQAAAQSRLGELTALVSVIGDVASGRGSGPVETSHAAVGMANAAGYDSLHELAFSLANGLKSKLGCDQVALGTTRRRGIRILCVSGFDELYPRSPGTRLLQQAMCECLDARDVICVQREDGTSQDRISTGHRLHASWHVQAGNQPVASIPLVVQHATVAVVSLRNPPGQNFTREKLQKIQDVLQPLAANLVLLEQANQSLARHCSDVGREWLGKFREPGRWRRKVLAAVLIAATAWVALGTTQYTVSVPCLVEPSGERHVAAPFEGQLAASLVRPGDAVRAGQLVAVMETRELKLERAVVEAELRIARVDTARAIADQDLAAAAQAEADADRARNRLLLIDRRIERSEVRAPCDGFVVEGDLAPRVGETVPLGEPLLRIASADAWKLKLHVPEFAATLIALDQAGEVALAARPDVTLPLKVRRLDAESVAHEGRNVFRAEAEPEGTPPPWWRSGMEGVARVDLGRHPIWWVWLHRVIDGARLQIWKL